ncbi:uncharacterized protein LOC143231500 [Tachypleus tridentatus]|uniref:uncharacterized protein LOC143231500 n=1 Tax=Tachypleus tridentatus TaxID=6853 RepID=UPI003FD6A222
MKHMILLFMVISVVGMASIIGAFPLELAISYETSPTFHPHKSALFWEEMPALDTVMKRIIEKVKKLTDGLQLLVERSIKAWQIFMGGDSGTTVTEEGVTTGGETTEEYPA